MSKKKKKKEAEKEEERNGRFSLDPRRTRLVLAGTVLASALIGFVAVIQFRTSPFFELPIIDEQAYVNWASEIASGRFLGERVFYQDPLYPYILGALFALFGKSFFLVRAVQVLMGAAAVALVFFTGRKIMGDAGGLLAAGILAAYRGMYFFELLLLKATAVLFLSALACLLGVWASDRPESKPRWLATGACLGGLTLLRGNFQAIIPFMAALPFFMSRDAPATRRLLRSGFVIAGVLLVILPVSIRNYAVGGEFVLTTSQGGANFFIGNNPRANGRYVTLPFVRANPKWEAGDFEKEAERRAGRELSPSEVSRFWFKQSFKWISENPADAFKLLLFKARLMVHQHEIPDNHSFYLARRIFAPVLWIPALGFGLLWGPAVIGTALMRKEERAWFPAAFALLYAGSIIPFFIVARYRLAVVPAMAVFAAAFCIWAAQKWREAEWKPLCAAGGALLLSVLIGFLPTPVSTAPMGMEYYLLGNAYLKTGEPEEALAWYDRARSVLPDNEDIARNRAEAMLRLNTSDVQSLAALANRPGVTPGQLVEIGRRLENLGQITMAVELYKAAAARDPELFSPRARLGYLYSTRPEVRDTAKAIGYLREALAIRPGDLDTMNALGNVNFLAGNTDRARQWWEAALERDPAYDAARRNLGMLEAGKE